MDLYVVTSALPGPGAAAHLREVLDPLEERIGAVRHAAAITAVNRACEFVELETADGQGVGPASGIDWEPHPTADGLYRLGPFRVVAA